MGFIKKSKNKNALYIYFITKTICMRIFFLLAVSIIGFYSCTKQNEDFQSTGNYSGLLDSISISSGDSGIININNALRVKFSYDTKQRINKIASWDGNYHLFSYTDNSKNPSMLIDSFVGAQTLSAEYHFLTYNSSGFKIKDTITKTCITSLSNNSRNCYTPVIKFKTFDNQPDFLSINVNNNTTNTAYFNSEGDVTLYSGSSVGFEQDTITGFYPDINPFYKLNIRNAGVDERLFLYSSLYPLHYDISLSKHIIKEVKGSNFSFYRYQSGEITKIKFSYNKDVAGNVDKMVLNTSAYSRYTGMLLAKFYTTVKFHYHP